MNLRHVDLNLLVVLEAILSEQGVSKAARRMHLSQSALSHGLARLRDLVGDPLLVRVGRTMELTPKAQALLPEVRQVLAQIETLVGTTQVFDPRRVERVVHLGASDWVSSSVLAGLAGTLEEEAPGLRLHIHHCGRVDAPELLRSGKLDLALGIFPSATSDLDLITLREEPYVCTRRAECTEPQPTSLQEFLSATHVNVLVQGDTLGGVDSVLARQGLRRDIRVTVAHFQAALIVSSQTSHWFTGPESLIRSAIKDLGLQVFAPPLPLPLLTTQMAWSNRTETDACLVWLRHLLQVLCK
jgi:DNA-binding transcriptional LysR family regulator